MAATQGDPRVGPGLVWPGQPAPQQVKLGGREFWSTGWHAIAFVESHCVYSDGAWVGQRAELMAWQKRLLWRLFEVEVDTDGYWIRRYRRALLGIPRKNGKSQLASWLALYFLCADGEPAAYVVCGANSEEQADIVFNGAKLCAEKSGTLSQLTSGFAGEIIVPTELNARMERVSYKAKTKEGLNIHAVILDEIHEFDEAGRQLNTVLTKGVAARRQPFVLWITTAGYDLDTFCGELYQHGKQVNSGEVIDHHFFCQWYEADEKLPIDKEEAWKQANPSYGVTIRPAYFGDELQANGPDAFKRYNLNRWTTTRQKWLADGEWEALGIGPFDLERGDDRPVFVGVDASSEHDTTAVLAGQWWGDILRVKAKIWERPSLPDGKPDLNWQLPIAEVEDHLRALHTTFRVPALGYDPAFITWTAQQLSYEGLQMVKVPQTNGSMCPATKALYELIREKRIAHDGDPKLARHIANAIKVNVSGGASRLAKVRKGVAHSVRNANDGAIALVIMVGQAGEPVPPPESPPTLHVEDEDLDAAALAEWEAAEAAALAALEEI